VFTVPAAPSSSAPKAPGSGPPAAASRSSTPTPGAGSRGAAAATAAPPQWRVCAADGQQYGPVSKAELDSWVAQGRLDERCQVYCDGWPQWKWAHDVYPQLHKPGQQQPGAADPFAALLGGLPAAAASTTAPTTVNPFQAPVTAGGGLIAGTAAFEGGWYAVRSALRVTHLACIVGAACALVMMLGFLAGANLDVPGFGARGSEQAAAFLASLTAWAFWGYVATLVTVITCELVAMAVPRASGAAGTLTGSLIAYAVALGIAFLLTVLLLPALESSPEVFRFGFLAIYAASCVGMALYGFFIGRTAALFGDRGIGVLAVIYAALVGALFVWSLLLMFAIHPTSQAMAYLVFLLTFFLIAMERVLLMLLALRGGTALDRARRPTR
jgi:uncharacterized protein YhhL (DUF1145 family)